MSDTPTTDVFPVPAGTLVYVRGMPFWTIESVRLRGHPANIKAALRPEPQAHAKLPNQPVTLTRDA